MNTEWLSPTLWSTLIIASAAMAMGILSNHAESVESTREYHEVIVAATKNLPIVEKCHTLENLNDEILEEIDVLRTSNIQITRNSSHRYLLSLIETRSKTIQEIIRLSESDDDLHLSLRRDGTDLKCHFGI